MTELKDIISNLHFVGMRITDPKAMKFLNQAIEDLEELQKGMD